MRIQATGRQELKITLHKGTSGPAFDVHWAPLTKDCYENSGHQFQANETTCRGQLFSDLPSASEREGHQLADKCSNGTNCTFKFGCCS